MRSRLISSLLLVSIASISAACKSNHELAAGGGGASAVQEAAASSQAADPMASRALAELIADADWSIAWPAQGASRCTVLAREGAVWWTPVAGGAGAQRLAARADAVAWRVVEVEGGCLAAELGAARARVHGASGAVVRELEVAPLRDALASATSGRRLYRDMVRQHAAVAVLWPHASGAQLLGLGRDDALAGALAQAELDGGVGLLGGWPSARPGGSPRPLWLVVAGSDGRRLMVGL